MLSRSCRAVASTVIVIEVVLLALRCTLRSFLGLFLQSLFVVSVSYGNLFGTDVNIEIFLCSCSIALIAVLVVLQNRASTGGFSIPSSRNCFICIIYISCGML